MWTVVIVMLLGALGAILAWSPCEGDEEVRNR